MSMNESLKLDVGHVDRPNTIFLFGTIFLFVKSIILYHTSSCQDYYIHLMQTYMQHNILHLQEIMIDRVHTR